MKEFDIEKAKNGAKVCTRDGRPVRVVCWDAKRGNFPIQVLILEENGWESRIGYSNKGISEKRYTSINDDDLMLVGKKREGWISLYKCNYEDYHQSMGVGAGDVFPDRQGAIDEADGDPDYICTIQISWEE